MDLWRRDPNESSKQFTPVEMLQYKQWTSVCKIEHRAVCCLFVICSQQVLCSEPA